MSSNLLKQCVATVINEKSVQITIVCILIAGYLFHRRSSTVDYSNVCARRVQARDSVVHRSLGSVSTNKIDLSLDAHDIKQLYKEGRVSPTDVVNLYCHQSHTVGKVALCAVTEELYDEAHAAAAELSVESQDKLPLWGVPISIKDCIQQKGTDATCGAAAKCFKPFAEDGLQVKLLREAGALLHVRSNVPQLLMMPESENNVWGRTLNPWDFSRTPGGSSGGEAALVASGCSVMGLGSDIGGSIRIPAHYCGLVGLKPTPMRITTMGSVAPRFQQRNGQMIIKPVVGPIARSVRDCGAMMKALTAPMVTEEDPFLAPLPPWDENLSATGPSDLHRPLKIGMMVTDDWFEASDACQRAVRTAGKVLADQVNVF